MMHNDKTIVTLREMPSKSPLKEYGHFKDGAVSSVTTYLKFESEYAIGFKFADTIRRRVEIRIDGSLITDQLILSGTSNTILERFVDSDRRFKFVAATHEAVSDPTNPKNGEIEIKIWREFQLIPETPIWRDRPKDKYWPHNQFPQNSIMYGGIQDCSYSTASSVLRSVPISLSSVKVGATVEGSKSSQVIGTTTWMGDCGDPLIFKFRILGSNTAGYCGNCGTEISEADNYCRMCGKSVK